MVPPEGTDHLAGFVKLSWVEPRGGLVEQQDLGAPEQRLGEADPLPVAARELVDLATYDVLQPARGGDALDLGRDFAACDALRLGDEAEERVDAERLVERGPLRQVADRSRRLHVVDRHVVPAHDHPP